MNNTKFSLTERMTTLNWRISRMANIIAETTHHVQKALITNACIYIKYIEKIKPAIINILAGANGMVPFIYSKIQIKIVINIKNPK